jgi:uncharacterized membrane protein (DUF4010 family)
MATNLEPFASLALALAAGLLIGLERERSAPSDPQSFLGGVRTHPLFALVGGLASMAAHNVGVVVLALAFSALILLLAVNYAGDVLRDRSRGITSEAAFLLSFLLGALATSTGAVEPFADRALVVAATAVVVTFLLSSKSTLHPLVQRVTTSDIGATLKFLVVAVVVLPLLPDRTYGPYAVLNPFKLGVLLVLISAISFAGYAAMRLLGAERGLGLTGLVGGVASSTALTLAVAGRARENPTLAEPAAFAAMLASTVMFGRLVVVMALVNPALIGPLLYPMAAGALGGLATGRQPLRARARGAVRAALRAGAARLQGGVLPPRHRRRLRGQPARRRRRRGRGGALDGRAGPRRRPGREGGRDGGVPGRLRQHAGQGLPGRGRGRDGLRQAGAGRAAGGAGRRSGRRGAHLAALAAARRAARHPAAPSWVLPIRRHANAR